MFFYDHSLAYRRTQLLITGTVCPAICAQSKTPPKKSDPALLASRKSSFSQSKLPFPKSNGLESDFFSKAQSKNPKIRFNRWVNPAQLATYRTLFTLPLFFVLFANSLLAQISLPQPPAAAIPPAIPADQDPAMRRQRERAAQRQSEEEKKIEELSSATETAKIEKEREDLKKPRPFYGFVELSMLYPKVLTTGNRTNYRADMTTHVNVLGRLKPDQPVDETQMWLGFRLAPFGGSGAQKNQKGRFSLTYFGPAVGVGSIGKPGDPFSESPRRHGFLLSAGIAAVSRLQEPTELSDPGRTDFQATPYAMDSPGVWSEIRSIHTFYGSLSYNLVAGTQLAEGKTLLYLGAGFAGWL